MILELSPPVYLALCGLVEDALAHPSDATPLLKRVAQELANGTAGAEMPVDLEEGHMEALRRTSFVE